MFYIKLNMDDENELIYYCRKCGNETNELVENNVIVSKTNVIKQNKNFKHIINEYTKLDPTLPHIDTIPCPNKECICNTDESVKYDLIYIRYDETNMKYIYICNHCNYNWKN